jgi:hypothetical protein
MRREIVEAGDDILLGRKRDLMFQARRDRLADRELNGPRRARLQIGMQSRA